MLKYFLGTDSLAGFNLQHLVEKIQQVFVFKQFVNIFHLELSFHVDRKVLMGLYQLLIYQSLATFSMALMIWWLGILIIIVVCNVNDIIIYRK